MKNLRMKIGAALVLACTAATWGVSTSHAQQPGFKRVELQKHDLGMPGREMVQARGEIEAGAAVPRHSHPGEEVAYVLEGQVLVEIEGKPAATLKAGEVFFVPAGQVHAVKNVGKSQAKVLSTYIVEKGKPLATPAK